MVDIFIIMNMSTMIPSGLSVMNGSICHRFRVGGGTTYSLPENYADLR